ncbi:hypothetical protein AB1Y20_002769 [Prymnesium parvum]|uniref:Uncharacterized protein n=1 Tax=Prymnesium parvum TaxID=97485 RepID=A0AB34JAI4_PRYPA
MAPHPPRLLAYAPVGTHSATGANPEEASVEVHGKTLILAAGLGWLYGLGCVVGPFYGVGVGLTFPGGVLAGAGGGVGVVIGIGMGAGAVWGSGRGHVVGYSVSPPMNPPFAAGYPKSWPVFPSSKRSAWGGEGADLDFRLRSALHSLRSAALRRLQSFRRPRVSLLHEPTAPHPPLAFAAPPRRRACASGRAVSAAARAPPQLPRRREICAPRVWAAGARCS